jgi:putative NIF3 family GTP cyclohydrolase 1 type 2
MEAGINVIFGGHYETEIWGVKAFSRLLAEETGLETEFIDVPTGL